MPKVSSADVQKDFGQFEAMAETEPVFVMQSNKASVVIVSAEEYARLKRRDKRAMATEELPGWIIDQIAGSEMDPKYDRLDEDA